MKIHIVQKNDTFQSIAEKYSVSVQDLIGMNTHINHLAGLVPGLKVKVPSPARKEETNVAQHIQKYYPNLDTNPIELKSDTTVESEPIVAKMAQPQPASIQQVQQIQPIQPVAVQQTQHIQSVQPAPVQQPGSNAVPKVQEEVMPVPLKPMHTETPTQPNDGVKVGAVATSVEQTSVSVSQKTYQPTTEADTKSTETTVQKPYPYPFPVGPSWMMYAPYKPSCSSNMMPYPPMNPYAVSPYGAPYPTAYTNPYAPTCGARGTQDERFFVGGFGYPFFGGGWGGYNPYYGGFGWGGYPYYGGWYPSPYL